jgi:DNA-binding MarR family transcriptional regulator
MTTRHDGFGLTAQQHQALLAIRGFGIEECLTVGELAQWLNLRSHSVVGLVNRLVGRGLVAPRPLGNSTAGGSYEGLRRY